MSRPTFFLSSTIFDFSDLRSAVKYFLEQQGCIVLASEFSDFRKPLEPHSYHACLDTISQADYFILFIGARVGGWYDKNNKVSITQQEYREAYKLHKEGNLKIINFIRSDVWTRKEDRKELAHYLNSIDIEPDLKTEISNYPSKHLDDAKFIINFIDEVGRNKETRKALREKSNLPTGNWLHIFSTFKEVIDVLQTQAFLSQPVEVMATKRLLKREISDILRNCLSKFKGGDVCSPKISVLQFNKMFRLEAETITNPKTKIESKALKKLYFFAIGLFKKRLRIFILPQVLTTTTFVFFDPESKSFKEEPIYEALFLLQEQIERFNQIMKKFDIIRFFLNHSNELNIDNNIILEVDTTKLINCLILFDRWINIIDLSRSILQYLDGNSFVMPTLRPASPIHESNQELKAETVTLDDVNKYINSNDP